MSGRAHATNLYQGGGGGDTAHKQFKSACIHIYAILYDAASDWCFNERFNKFVCVWGGGGGWVS